MLLSKGVCYNCMPNSLENFFPTPKRRLHMSSERGVNLKLASHYLSFFDMFFNSFCQNLSFLNIFFNRFCPLEKCGVTLDCLYPDSLTVSLKMSFLCINNIHCKVSYIVKHDTPSK